MNRRVLSALLGVVGAVATVAIWWLATENSASVYFPPLSRILETAQEHWLSAEGRADIASSIGNLLSGLAIGVVAGIVVGVALGQVSLLHRALSPSIEFVRAIPATALLPFAMMLFGLGTEMKVFLIALGCVWPVLLNALDGTRSLEPTLRDTASVYGITGVRRQLNIVLPSAAPRIASGIRVAIPLSLILTVTSEMVGSHQGIGFVIVDAQNTFRITDMWSGVLLLGVLGFALTWLFGVAEKLLLPWEKRAERTR
ncbi:ABC transporter permease [Saccharopolyspora sp. NPDC050389]|uniref:ABC transporter permease n=1 Tax=Saccharopolyspora sp. NPDC050389 TaxID=3155516 RepID=UPI0034038377